MGVDYSSYAAIGIRVKPESLYTKRVVKAFKHNHPATMKFCPDTGKKLWEEIQVPVVGDVDDDLEKIGPYEVYRSTDDHDYVIAIFGASSGDHIGRTAIPSGFDLEAEKAKLRKELKKYDIPWDEKEFGLWSVLYCSY